MGIMREEEVMPDDAKGRCLVGLVGTGIGPSLSPPLHEQEAQKLGIGYVYRRLDLNDLDRPPGAVGEIVLAARRAGYDGLNITHPCKQLVLRSLDGLAPEAAALGAVNTVVFGSDGAVGYNTDRSGFMRAVGLGLPHVALEHAVLLGAGGAGAAAAHGLLTLGAGRVSVFDVNGARAVELAQLLARQFGGDRAVAGSLPNQNAELAKALHTADGLVHATPVGMAADPGIPVPVELLRPDMWVADVVYRPLETELVAAARRLGCRVLDGGRMAVFQAADAFELFTGIHPDTSRMLRHFDILATSAAKKSQTHA